MKLGAGFGALIVLMVVLALFGLRSLSASNERTVYLATNTTPSVELIGHQDTWTDDYRILQLQHVIATSGDQMTSIERGLTAKDAQIDAGFARYERMISDAQDRAAFERAKAQWQKYKGESAPFLALSRRLDTEGASAVLRRTQTTFDALTVVVRRWQAYNDKLAAHRLASSRSAYSSSRTLMLLLLAAAIAVGAGLAFVVSRSIKGGVDTVLDRLTSLRDHCMTSVREGLEALAQGDLTRSYQPVTEPIPNPSRDEIGQVADAVNGMRERAIAALDAYNESAERLRETVGHVARAANTVGSSSEQMAATSEQAGSATGEIANAVGDLSQGAERQVKMVEEARRAAEEVTRAVAESAENAQAAAQVAHEAREVAQQGVGAAEHANEAMRSVRDSSAAVTEAIRELAAKSEQIGAIVATITGIAEQTNLLALNAAIEAARAGEQGRGFAVVAEEVRKLAEESQRAAQEISGLIGAIQVETERAVSVVDEGAGRTQDGAAVVEQTREAFQRIEASVVDMTARIEQIAATAQQISGSADTMQHSIDEVAAVAEQSSASTQEVSASTEETTASAQEIAGSAQELAGSAQELNELVAQFKTSV